MISHLVYLFSIYHRTHKNLTGINHADKFI